MLWAWEKFYSSVVDKWLKCLSTFFVFLQCSCCKTQPVTPKEDELTELIVAFLTNRRDQQRQKGEGEKKKKDQTKSNKDKKKKKKKSHPNVFFGTSFEGEGGKKEKPARPHNWSGFLKEFLSPVSMGRTPAEQLQRQAMAPHERFLPGGGEANDLIAKKVNCFPAERQKAQEELHHGVWDISKYLTDFSIMKKKNPPSSLSLFFFSSGEVLFFLPPPTRHTPIRPPDWPVSLFGPREFKASLLGAAQCALTPCNEISSCC